jgi:hypothetical protein
LQEKINERMNRLKEQVNNHGATETM